MIKTLESFEKQLARANPEQKEAIETIYGPVLVLAGPGTGKTQILSLRIGNILLQTDASPYQILCLTYTEAGAMAMKDRLIRLIGTEGHKVHIHTFHSFCNQLIQEHKYAFAAGKTMQPLSDLERIEILHQMIDELDDEHRLKKFAGDIYDAVGKLQSLFSDVKRENLEIQNIILQCEQYLAELPLLPEFQYKRNSGKNKKGDPNLVRIKEVTRRIMDTVAGLRLFEIFEQKLRSAQRYDFDDMLLWVIRALEADEELLALIQEKYQFILVDEFQDTNGAQMKVLDLICSFEEAPNLFVVGDDDQSIYSFQGAENHRVKSFVEKYKAKLKAVVLKTNYRSYQEILDCSARLIEHNKGNRLVDDLEFGHVVQRQGKLVNKQLQAFQGKGARVRILAFGSEEHEVAYLAHEIWDAHQSGESLHEIAVLYRSHKDVLPLLKVLTMMGVPFEIKKKDNILKDGLIQNLILLYQYFYNRTYLPANTTEQLFKILYMPYWDIDPKDLQRLIIFSKDSKIPLYELVHSADMLLLAGVDRIEAFENFRILTQDMLTEVVHGTLLSLTEAMVNKLGIMNHILTHAHKLHQLETLRAWYGFIETERMRNPHLDLKGLLDIIQKMDEGDLSIPLERVFRQQSGVQFITAHSSKGLEFEKVYVIKANSQNWEKKRSGGHSFLYPPSLSHIKASQEEESKILEERRLFYVALTRAKQQLTVSFTDPTLLGVKEKGRSIFVDELLGDLEVSAPEVRNEWMEKVQIAWYKPEANYAFPGLESTYIDQLLKNYRLSYSHLKAYLDCKLTFYLQYILKVPTFDTPAAAYGKAIHFALEHFYRDAEKSKSATLGTAQELIDHFVEGMKKFKSGFTEKEYALKLTLGKNTLSQYYEQYKDTLWANSKIEYTISDAVVDNVPIKGRIDKIEIHGSMVNVVDYKTGGLSKIKQHMKPLTTIPPDDQPITELGGEYWRQVLFYKLLLDHHKPFQWTMNQATIDMLVLDKEQRLERVQQHFFEPEHLRFMRRLIKEAYQGIMSHDFYQGCGKEECTWCTFVANNYRYAPVVNDPDVPAE